MWTTALGSENICSMLSYTFKRADRQDLPSRSSKNYYQLKTAQPIFVQFSVGFS